MVSDSGQNLRHNVHAGGIALLDGELNNGMVVAVAGIAGASVTNLAFASPSEPNGASRLYSVDLSTGVATALGQMRTRAPLVDIALPIAQ